MSYGKSWAKAVSKIQQHSSLPMERWNHYQLLGYVLSRTKQTFEPIEVETIQAGGFAKRLDTCPSRHPMVRSMEWIRRQFKTVPEAIQFLDWAIARRKSNLKINALRFMHAKYEPIPSKPLERAQELPQYLITLFQDYPSIKTYGDLSFLSHAYPDTVRDRLSNINIDIATLRLNEIA